jgi:hypothetical protein
MRNVLNNFVLADTKNGVHANRSFSTWLQAALQLLIYGTDLQHKTGLNLKS